MSLLRLIWNILPGPPGFYNVIDPEWCKKFILWSFILLSKYSQGLLTCCPTCLPSPCGKVDMVTPTHYATSAMSRSSQLILQFWGDRGGFTHGPSFKQVCDCAQVLYISCPWHCPYVFIVDDPGVSYQESPCFYIFQSGCVPCDS
jgi:hypothetical protein